MWECRSDEEEDIGPSGTARRVLVDIINEDDEEVGEVGDSADILAVVVPVVVVL